MFKQEGIGNKSEKVGDGSSGGWDSVSEVPFRGSQETKWQHPLVSSNPDIEGQRRKSAEELERRTEHEWNMEHYGADIPAATARAAFESEFAHLSLKVAKEKTPSQIGDYTTPEERKQYGEMRRIKDLGNSEERERWGRRKERAYREAMEAKKAQPLAFGKAMRANKHSLPPKWDDGKTSLAELEAIRRDTMHLREK